MKLKRAVFLDRDGVINKRLAGGYVKRIEEFELIPDVVEALKQLRLLSDYLFIVTNQQGIGKKLMTIDDLNKIHHYMIQQLQKHNVWFDAIYYCPHHREEKCECRKPAIGLFKRAINDFPDIDVATSWMVGDTDADAEFAMRSGLNVAIISKDRFIENKNIYFFDNLLEFVRYFFITITI